METGSYHPVIPEIVFIPCSCSYPSGMHIPFFFIKEIRFSIYCLPGSKHFTFFIKTVLLSTDGQNSGFGCTGLAEIVLISCSTFVPAGSFFSVLIVIVPAFRFFSQILSAFWKLLQPEPVQRNRKRFHLAEPVPEPKEKLSNINFFFFIVTPVCVFFCNCEGLLIFLSFIL